MLYSYILVDKHTLVDLTVNRVYYEMIGKFHIAYIHSLCKIILRHIMYMYNKVAIRPSNSNMIVRCNIILNQQMMSVLTIYWIIAIFQIYIYIASFNSVITLSAAYLLQTGACLCKCIYRHVQLMSIILTMQQKGKYARFM